MRVVRQTPQALNKPLLILGVDRVQFALLFLLSTLLAKVFGVLVGVPVFVVGFQVAKRVTRKDPDILKIGAVLWRMRALYDPIKREPFRMEMEDD